MSAIVLNSDHPEDRSGFETTNYKALSFPVKAIQLFHHCYFILHSVSSRTNYIMHHLEVPNNWNNLQSASLVAWPQTGHKNILEECQSRRSVGEQLH